MRRWGGFAGVAAIAMLLAACPGPSTPPANDVRIAIYSEPSSLSLIGNTDLNSSQLASLISDGLVAYDAQMRYVPMVARSWEFSPDGTTLTFHLRDDVLWHDGARLTSKDVAFTVAKINEPATLARAWVSAFANIASITTPDDTTVVVHYAAPYADALEPWRVPIIPEHVAAKDADFLDGSFAHHPVGCGPFVFSSREPGQSVVLTAFDRYWGGRPALDRMVVKILSNERTGFEALLMGDLDQLTVTPDLWRESLTSPRAAGLARFVFYRLNSWKIDWNQYEDKPFFHDKRVRRAMLLALDRKHYAETVAGGLARPAVSSFLPESPWADPSIVAIPFDPVESGRLLDEAGWRRPSPGAVRRKDGVPFTFSLMFPAGSQEIADRSAAWIQQSLAEVGVDMKIEKVANDVFKDRRKKHEFDAAMATLVFDATPDRYDLYHSKARDGGFNYGGFSDPGIDRLLDEARATVEPEARRAITFRLEQQLDDLQPVAFIFQYAQPVLLDSALQGVVPSSVGLFQFAPGPRAWHWSGARRRP